MNQLAELIHRHRPSLLCFVTAFFLTISAYDYLLGIANAVSGVNSPTLVEQWPDALVLAAALFLLLAGAMFLDQPRPAAAIALFCSIASLPHFFALSYAAFYAALIFICIVPPFYLVIWIPLACVVATAIFSVRILFSRHPETV